MTSKTVTQYTLKLCTISFDFTHYALIMLMPQSHETLNVTKIF